MSRVMKDSGIEWIGQIPENWKLERLQWHIDEIKINNNPVQTKQVLSLTNKLGVIPYEEKGAQGNTSKEDYSQYKLAYPHTIVANSMNILIGSVGVCDYFGCVSPVYYVYKPRIDSTLRFFNYIFQSQPFQKELRCYANGILEIRLRVSSNDILKREVAIPPLNEQQRIMDVLEEKSSMVDSIISNQEQQIEKLKAYKQSLITEVVTKGLNPNVPMKDSGVSFIGNVPSHWQIKRAKYVADKLVKGKGISKEEVFENGNTKCVRYGEIYTKYNQSFIDCCSKTNIEIIKPNQTFCYGDILFAGTGELIEEIGKSIVYLGNEKCLAGGDIVVMKHSENPSFLNYALNSTYAQTQKSCGKAKLKVVHISATDIGNIILAIPPIEEQEKIAEYLDLKCSQIDRLIEIKQSKIEKLEQYKKSLIYEYVTGKKEAV